jgi:hypothetical protein
VDNTEARSEECGLEAVRQARSRSWRHPRQTRIRGRLNAKDFAAADPDHDGTLDKNEFLALVEKRFKTADPDNDGTIDAKELQSAVGHALVSKLNLRSLLNFSRADVYNKRLRRPARTFSRD